MHNNIPDGSFHYPPEIQQQLAFEKDAIPQTNPNH